MFEISERLYELALSYARAGGFINECIALVICFVDAAYLISLFLLPFRIGTIARNIRR